MQLGQLYDVPHATLLRQARECDLLLLRTLGRVGQQEGPVHAGAGRRIESTSSKSPFTNCTCGNRCASTFCGSRVTARACTPWVVNLLTTSLFAPHRPGRPGDQKHWPLSVKRPTCACRSYCIGVERRDDQKISDSLLRVTAQCRQRRQEFTERYLFTVATSVGPLKSSAVYRVDNSTVSDSGISTLLEPWIRGNVLIVRGQAPVATARLHKSVAITNGERRQH
jgi:hypothetical protein